MLSAISPAAATTPAEGFSTACLAASSETGRMRVLLQLSIMEIMKDKAKMFSADRARFS